MPMWLNSERAEKRAGITSRSDRRRAVSVALSAFAWLIGPAPALSGDPQRGEPKYQRYCSGCHGADGRGGAKNFMPHVGALTRKGYTDLLEDNYLAAIIAEGGEPYGKSAYMPAWKSTLSDEDIADVIAYVRTFPLY